ncbi:MAG: ABC transporter permease [Hyphomicrobiales bacterium]|nr:ABC transporter permease [Hyphomicrobiales bacterium]
MSASSWRLKLVARANPSRALVLLAPVLAVALALVFGALMILALGKSPVEAFNVYFAQPLADPFSLAEIVVKASPLVMIALGLAFCYRANLWNIGAEGQFVIGGTLGGGIAVATHGMTHATFWILPAMLVIGALGGALYALIPAVLKVTLGVSEILVSLMLVYVAQLNLDYLVRGPWRDPKGFNFPVTAGFDPSATLPPLWPGGAVHSGVAITVLLVIIMAVVLARTRFGFAVRTAGMAPRAAGFAGFDHRRLTLALFALSGGLAGLAGVVEVSGVINQLQPSISPGYGFAAIIVAFLGRLSPVGILVAGLVLALTYIGGEAAQIAMKLPLDLTTAFQGVVLMCVLAADVLTHYRLTLARRAS